MNAKQFVIKSEKSSLAKRHRRNVVLAKFKMAFKHFSSSIALIAFATVMFLCFATVIHSLSDFGALK